MESCDKYYSFLVKNGDTDSLLKQINTLLSSNKDERYQGLTLLQI